jgi:hypothetical protein
MTSLVCKRTKVTQQCRLRLVIKILPSHGTIVLQWWQSNNMNSFFSLWFWSYHIKLQP